MVFVLVREKQRIDGREGVPREDPRRVDDADASLMAELRVEERVHEESRLPGREEPPLMAEEREVERVPWLPRLDG